MDKDVMKETWRKWRYDENHNPFDLTPKGGFEAGFQAAKELYEPKLDENGLLTGICGQKIFSLSRRNNE